MISHSNRKGTHLLPIWASEGLMAFGMCAGTYVLDPMKSHQLSGTSESPNAINRRPGHMSV